MRCPRCGGYMKTVILQPGRCPACGKIIKRIPTLTDIKEFWAQFFHGRGLTFWTFIAIVLLGGSGMIEQSLGNGYMLNYLLNNWFIGLVTAVFLGAVLDLVSLTNVEIRELASVVTGRLPRALRLWRRGTNTVLILGAVAAVLIMSPREVFDYPPAFVFLVVFILCCFWASYAFFLTDEFARDTKTQIFFKRLGVDFVADLRRVSMYYLIGALFSVIIFVTLHSINGLWIWMSTHPIFQFGIQIGIWADRLLRGKIV